MNQNALAAERIAVTMLSIRCITARTACVILCMAMCFSMQRRLICVRMHHQQSRSRELEQGSSGGITQGRASPPLSHVSHHDDQLETLVAAAADTAALQQGQLGDWANYSRTAHRISPLPARGECEKQIQACHPLTLVGESRDMHTHTHTYTHTHTHEHMYARTRHVLHGAGAAATNSQNQGENRRQPSTDPAQRGARSSSGTSRQPAEEENSDLVDDQPGLFGALRWFPL